MLHPFILQADLCQGTVLLCQQLAGQLQIVLALNLRGALGRLIQRLLAVQLLLHFVFDLLLHLLIGLSLGKIALLHSLKHFRCGLVQVSLLLHLDRCGDVLDGQVVGVELFHGVQRSAVDRSQIVHQLLLLFRLLPFEMGLKGLADGKIHRVSGHFLPGELFRSGGAVCQLHLGLQEIAVRCTQLCKTPGKLQFLLAEAAAFQQLLVLIQHLEDPLGHLGQSRHFGTHHQMSAADVDQVPQTLAHGLTQRLGVAACISADILLCGVIGTGNILQLLRGGNAVEHPLQHLSVPVRAHGRKAAFHRRLGGAGQRNVDGGGILEGDLGIFGQIVAVGRNDVIGILTQRGNAVEKFLGLGLGFQDLHSALSVIHLFDLVLHLLVQPVGPLLLSLFVPFDLLRALLHILFHGGPLLGGQSLIALQHALVGAQAGVVVVLQRLHGIVIFLQPPLISLFGLFMRLQLILIVSHGPLVFLYFALIDIDADSGKEFVRSKLSLGHVGHIRLQIRLRHAQSRLGQLLQRLGLAGIDPAFVHGVPAAARPLAGVLIPPLIHEQVPSFRRVPHGLQLFCRGNAIVTFGHNAGKLLSVPDTHAAPVDALGVLEPLVAAGDDHFLSELVAVPGHHLSGVQCLGPLHFLVFHDLDSALRCLLPEGVFHLNAQIVVKFDPLLPGQNVGAVFFQQAGAPRLFFCLHLAEVQLRHFGRLRALFLPGGGVGAVPPSVRPSLGIDLAHAIEEDIPLFRRGAQNVQIRLGRRADMALHHEGHQLSVFQNTQALPVQGIALGDLLLSGGSAHPGLKYVVIPVSVVARHSVTSL